MTNQTELESKVKELEERVYKLESLFQQKPETISKSVSIREFLLEKKPTKDWQKALAILYFFEVFKEIQPLNINDLEAGYREAKEKIPEDNLPYKLYILSQKGLIMEDEQKKDNLKSYILTNSGIFLVEKNFNSRKMIVKDILETSYNKELADNIIESYSDVENFIALNNWKTSELDAGHFVESIRRLIELELTGNIISFTSRLNNFNDAELKRYESMPGDESFRIIIPRVLHTIYTIRNKRGVGHATGIKANEMDATYMLYAVKWVLAEIVRLKSSFSIPESQRIVDKIIERRIEILWKDGDIKRILVKGLDVKKQILILLYDYSPQADIDLFKSTNYRNITRFKKEILPELSNDIFIHYDKGVCTISPTGRIEAEKIILDYKH